MQLRVEEERKKIALKSYDGIWSWEDQTKGFQNLPKCGERQRGTSGVTRLAHSRGIDVCRATFYLSVDHRPRAGVSDTSLADLT